MNKHTVEKIGGTSMASGKALEGILTAGRDQQNMYQRIFVLSAYSGITNQLLEHKKTGKPGVFALIAESQSNSDWDLALSEVEASMLQINARVFAGYSGRQAADQFVHERVEDVRNCLLDLLSLCSHAHFSIRENLQTVRELLASLGEAHSAHNTTLLLHQRAVNARLVDLTGWQDAEEQTMDERISQAFSQIDLATDLPIVTGYARSRKGLCHEFGRGYTEITFSRIAVLTQAREAIIHKEFHLSSADPLLVGESKVRKIGRTNYDVADQLANMGMEAVHPRAAKGLRQADIPLRVKNSFDPEDAGTLICGNYVSDQPRAEIVTGITNVYALEYFEQDMVGVKGYDAMILEALKRHQARIITKTSNANTIVHYLDSSPGTIRALVTELSETNPTATVSTRKVAIVSAIGSDLKLNKLTTLASAALADAGVEILGIHQLIRNVDIQFVIDESHYEAAIVALHHRLIECEPRQVLSARNISRTAEFPAWYAMGR